MPSWRRVLGTAAGAVDRAVVLAIHAHGARDRARAERLTHLGGYTSALLATISDAFDFTVPMIPLASVADFAREQGRLGVGDAADAQHAALEKANWVVSPLARPLRLPKSRALVIAAESDRITPTAHATRLARHFDCEMLTIAGGHLLQLGRGDGYRAFARLLEREGILPTRRPTT